VKCVCIARSMASAIDHCVADDIVNTGWRVTRAIDNYYATSYARNTWPIATGLSACLSVTTISCVKLDEPVEMDSGLG